MNKLLATLALATVLSPAPASAANRYLYFMVTEGGHERVFNVAMEPVYSRVFRGGEMFTCTYKHSGGAVAKLEFEGAHCSGDVAGLTMSIAAKTAEGRKIETTSTITYVDHKYILLTGDLSGLTDNQNPVSMAIASATNYAKMQGQGSELPPIASVPTVAVGTAADAERVPVGSLACWLESRHYLCR